MVHAKEVSEDKIPRCLWIFEEGEEVEDDAIVTSVEIFDVEGGIRVCDVRMERFRENRHPVVITHK
jgi:hypothetical protein